MCVGSCICWGKRELWGMCLLAGRQPIGPGAPRAPYCCCCCCCGACCCFCCWLRLFAHRLPTVMVAHALLLTLRVCVYPSCVLVCACACVQVATMQKFRRGVPDNSSVYVCKNSLMREATKVVPGWESLSSDGCSVSVSKGSWLGAAVGAHGCRKCWHLSGGRCWPGERKPGGG